MPKLTKIFETLCFEKKKEISKLKPCVSPETNSLRKHRINKDPLKKMKTFENLKGKNNVQTFFLNLKLISTCHGVLTTIQDQFVFF